MFSGFIHAQLFPKVIFYIPFLLFMSQLFLKPGEPLWGNLLSNKTNPSSIDLYS